LERLRELFWIVNGLIAFTLIVWLADLDRIIAALYYIPGQEHAMIVMRWQGLSHPFWLAIYKTASWPILLLGTLALFMLVSGLWCARTRAWRKQALFFLVFVALGPGLVVNVLLKDTLGKPRPLEIVEFGGKFTYAQFWEAGTGARNGSFPSGHASVAFALMGPWFFFRQRHTGMAAAFLIGGLAWGMLVGLSRIAQGGHFFSDVVWAGGLVYLIGGLLELYFSFDRSHPVVHFKPSASTS
jgi:membrane-associated PAP2 superfamily phosphatase